MFGEIAEQYDAYRPSYPDALFDTIVEFGDLHAGDRALEIGAGTGKATTGFVARGLDVHALGTEPGDGRGAAGQGRRGGGDAVRELGSARPAGSGWSTPRSRGTGCAATTATNARPRRSQPGGTVAFFWNKGREWTGALGDDNDARVRASTRPS